MIKVYIDWNVMSGMKRGDFSEFTEKVMDKNKFLLTYSTSHINDVFASLKTEEITEEQQVNISSDLEYITTLTDNLCVFNTSKSCTINYMNPHELFTDEFKNKEILSDFSIDKLLDNPLIDDSIKSFLKEMPIDETLKQALENPQYGLNKLFPNLLENPNMDGFFKSFGKMYDNSMNTESYKDIRSMVQKIGVNSAYFNPEKNPFNVIENAYKKHGMNYPNPYDYLKKDGNISNWFDKISSEYLILDMHGFQADKIKVTNRTKKTFRNTTEDSFHTAFASRFDFYITADNANIDKSKAVYKKMGINTKILRPNEFVEYYNSYLNKHYFVEHFLHIFEVLKKGENILSHVEEDEVVAFVKFTDEYFFNFFNKVYAPLNSQEYGAKLILSRENPSSPSIILPMELEKLIKIFTDGLGVDVNKKSYFDYNEQSDDELWIIREWIINQHTFTLKYVRGWYQLYLYEV